jgi:hypothetical protein
MEETTIAIYKMAVKKEPLFLSFKATPTITNGRKILITSTLK